MTYRLSIEGHYHQLLSYCKTQIDNGIKLFIVDYFDITTNGQKLADQISPYVRQKADQVDKLTGLKQIRYFEAYGATFLKKLLAKNESELGLAGERGLARRLDQAAKPAQPEPQLCLPDQAAAAASTVANI